MSAPGSRNVFAALALSVFAVGAIFVGWALAAGAPSHVRPAPTVVTIERDGLRYEYDAIAGTETLTDLTAPRNARENLAGTRSEDARRLRRLLEAQFRVDSLDRLREEHLRDVEELHRLGYL